MYGQRRTVRLREERDGPDRRYLDAYMEGGDLHIDGQDLGPGTASVSSDGEYDSDGEYEWFQVIRARHLAAFRELIGADAHENILDVLERSWCGKRAGDLQTLLHESNFPIERLIWSG